MKKNATKLHHPPRPTKVFVVVDKHGRVCSGNVNQGLTMPVADYARFLKEGKGSPFAGSAPFGNGVKRWFGGVRVVKMMLVPVPVTKRKSVPSKSKTRLKPSAITCDHANEVPRGVCKCPEKCYCRGKTCRFVKAKST